jgi:hypothetical protein
MSSLHHRVMRSCSEKAFKCRYSPALKQDKPEEIGAVYCRSCADAAAAAAAAVAAADAGLLTGDAYVYMCNYMRRRIHRRSDAITRLICKHVFISVLYRSCAFDSCMVV